MKAKTNGHSPSQALPRFAATEPSGIPSPPRKGLAARVPPTLAIAVVAGILAALFFLVATGSNTGTRVAVASRDIRAGEAVDLGDLRFANIDAPDSLVSTLLAPKDVQSVKGFITTHAIASGSLVSRSDLTPPAATARQRAMSVPIDPEHAAGGSLVPGDRVDVIDGSAAEPVFVITDAEVLAVAKPSGSSLGGTRKYSITVAIDAPGALRLAGAITRNKVEVVRSTGSPPAPLGRLYPQPAPYTATEASPAAPPTTTPQ